MNGSIILCDNIYETREGKFVICGTYNQWLCSSNILKIPQLQCYIRIYPERTGSIPACIQLRDDNMPPDHAPIMTANLQLEVRAEHIPVMEFAFRSAIPAEIKANFKEDSPIGSRFAIPLSLLLMVDGEIVATSPLKVVFSKSQ